MRADDVTGPDEATAGPATSENQTVADLLQRVEAFREAGRAKDAVDLLTAWIGSGKDAAQASVVLAKLLADRGDFEKARETLRKAQAAAPLDAAPTIELAKLALADDPAATSDERAAATAAILKDALASAPGSSRQAILMEYRNNIILANATRCELTDPSRPFRPGSVAPSAVLISMVKDEEDIIFAFLRHNYAIGFRKFVIMNNLSTDRTVSEIQRFTETHPDAVLVRIDDPVCGYYQDTKTTAMAHFAHSYFALASDSVEWIFPLDADEFMTFCQPDEVGNIPDLIEASKDQDVIQYQMLNCASPDIIDRCDPGIDPFVTFPVRGSTHVVRPSKVAFRYSPSVRLAMGNHTVRMAGAVAKTLQACTHGVVLSHFSLRSVHHARTKFVNGGIAYRAAPDRAHHGKRWQSSLANYEKWGDDWLVRDVKSYISRIRAYSASPA